MQWGGMRAECKQAALLGKYFKSKLFKGKVNF
jgi:hypothetical protein